MEVAHGSLANQLGIEHRNWQWNAAGAACITVAQGPGHHLKGIRRQIVVVMNQSVMGWAWSTLKYIYRTVKIKKSR